MGDLVGGDEWTGKILDILLDMSYVAYIDDLVHLVFPVIEVHDKDFINYISAVLMPAVLDLVTESHNSFA